MNNIIFFVFISFCFFGSNVFAQPLDSKIKGMKHITIGSPPPPLKDPIPEDGDKEKVIIKTSPVIKPIIIGADIREGEKKGPYFVEEDSLKEWPYLQSLISSDATQQSLAIQKLEKDPATASPMVLLLAADYFLKQNNKEKAALYLYASQLRAQFDMNRWPIINESGIRARHINHPAKKTLSLAQTTSQGLSGWVLSKKSRALTLFKTLKKWDQETPYAYKPFYEIPSSTDLDTWEETLKDTRTEFFKKQAEIITAIYPK